jgi:hypothetical protein
VALGLGGARRGLQCYSMFANNDGQTFDLKFDNTFLVPAGNSKFTFTSLSENAAILSTLMDAGNKSRVGL